MVLNVSLSNPENNEFLHPNSNEGEPLLCCLRSSAGAADTWCAPCVTLNDTLGWAMDKGLTAQLLAYVTHFGSVGNVSARIVTE